MIRKVASSLFPRDVIRLDGSRAGSGRKVVVTNLERRRESIGVDYLPVIDGGTLLGQQDGWTSLSLDEPVEIIGVFMNGALEPGSVGHIKSKDGDDSRPPRRKNRQKGESKMAATRTRKTASKSKPAPKAERAERQTDAQLDKLATRVVQLRDVKGQAWGDICDALDISPGKARSLYNRGGGEPREKAPAGSGEAKEGKSAGKRGSAAKRRAAKKS